MSKTSTLSWDPAWVSYDSVCVAVDSIAQVPNFIIFGSVGKIWENVYSCNEYKTDQVKHMCACLCLPSFSFTRNPNSYIPSPNCLMQRADCIKQARHAPGITATDEKLAVTENFLCTGGLLPFRDHIACSGMFPLRRVFINECILIIISTFKGTFLASLG